MNWDTGRLVSLISWGGMALLVARVVAYEMLIARLRQLDGAAWPDSGQSRSLYSRNWVMGSWKINRLVWSGRYRGMNDEKVNRYASAWLYMSAILWPMLLMFIAMVLYLSFPHGIPHG
jgi:hypothetical protein